MRNTRTLAIAAVLITFSIPSFSSFVGLPMAPETYPVAGFTRPCCSFVPSAFAKLIGIAGFLNPEKLGMHHFGKKKEGGKGDKVGMVFTCRAGFVDISHLRDNADWAAHIYQLLSKHIGSGKSFKVRTEKGIQEAWLVLPSIHQDRLRHLPPEKLRKIAEALTFDFALSHEIATSFKMAVSGPNIPVVSSHLANERSSSFSVEDAYSNYLGATLGAQAAMDERPYRVAMTDLLEKALDERRVVPLKDAEEIFNSLEGEWWEGSYLKGFEKVKKRVFTHRGVLRPRIPETEAMHRICGRSIEEVPLRISNVRETTRLPDHEVAYLKWKPTPSYARRLYSIGGTLDVDGYLTRTTFSTLIHNIRKDFKRKLVHMETTASPRP